MSNTDKTIRIGVDDKGVGQSNDRIRRSFEETQRRANEAAKNGKNLTKEEIEDLKKRLKLVEELSRKEDEIRRKRLDDKRIGINAAQVSLEEFRETRRKMELSVPGLKTDPNWRKEVDTETNERRAQILDQRKTYIEERKKYQDTKDDSKKQLSELRNIVSGLDKNADKTVRSNENIITSVFRGATGGMSGAVSGALGLLGATGAATVIINSLLSSAKSYQEGVSGYSRISGVPLTQAALKAYNLRDMNLGMGGIEIAGKMSSFLPYLSREMNDKELKGLIGAQLSRGFTDQQIQQLLSIQRYSGSTGIGTISTFENYVKETDRKSILKLPEILELYLRTANEILNRTGRVDALGVQQSIMSVGKSYNVSGVPLERTMGGLTQLSSMTENPVLLSIQQQAFRRLYPAGTPVDFLKKIQNPAEDPKFMEEVRSRLSKFGGGGTYTTLGVAGLLGGDIYTAERLMGGALKVSPKPTELDSNKVDAESKYYETSKEFVSGLQKIETILGKIPEFLSMALGNYFNMITDPAERKKHEQSIENAITNGLRKTYKERTRSNY